MYIKKEVISDFERGRLMQNPWIPNDSYKFDVQILGKKRRTFQLSWMKRFSWLLYSDAVKGALCKVCILFAKSNVGKGQHQSPQSLVNRPLKNWKDALEIFAKHEKAAYHKEAIISADNFLKIFDGKEENIWNKLNRDAGKHVQKNREMLAAVIQTIMLCGRQEIALRGTEDYGRICMEEPDYNDGNFRSLIRYRAKFDQILSNHILSTGANELYSSPIIQNELITLIGENIKSQIIRKALKANFFSILADGTTDIRQIEQFSLCIRYIDIDEYKMREDFIEFVPVEDATGEALASLIKFRIINMGLDLTKLRGQGYDGAGCMKGQFRGVQACIRREYPKALYTHCAAHCLNLSLADASKIQTIRNVFGTISEVCNFFRSSSKRANILKEELKSSDRLSVSCLQKYCETRWVERHEAVTLFADTFPHIIIALETIIDHPRDSEDTARASALHKNICSFSFIIGLFVCERFLGITYHLSEYLQNKCIDLNIAMEQVHLIYAQFSQMRDNADEEFKTLYGKAVTVGSNFGVSVNLPQRVGSQKHRENYETDSPEKYYRQSIFIPYLDEIKSSLEQRFLEHKEQIVSLHNIMPSNCIKVSFTAIESAINFYKQDLKNDNYSILEGEWDLWKMKWKRINEEKKPLPKYAIDALKECSKDIFPNISILLEILAILPVSTASVERSFSTLKRLKTYLRNSIGNEQLTALALMSVHREIKVEEKSVIDEFASKPRKKKFI